MVDTARTASACDAVVDSSCVFDPSSVRSRLGHIRDCVFLLVILRDISSVSIGLECVLSVVMCVVQAFGQGCAGEV